MTDKGKVLPNDPFNLYYILNKRKDSGDELKYPPGFTSSVIKVEEVNEKVKRATTNEVNEHVNSTSNKLEESVPKRKLSLNNRFCSKRVHTRGSMLQLMNELVKDLVKRLKKMGKGLVYETSCSFVSLHKTKMESMKHSYKCGVDQLERRLAEYKEREVKYIETIRSLERDKECNIRKINILTSDVETLQEEKDVVDGKLARLLKSSKDLEDIIESQRSENVKEGVGYSAVPPPAANLYHSPKKNLSWTGLPEFADDTVTDYSRPSPTVESTSTEGQNKHSTTAENGDKPAERPTTNKAEFVKAAERPTTDKDESAKKPAVRYAEMYKRTSK
nr:hypothetical protein [Tanacetum cinerariifolium]